MTMTEADRPATPARGQRRRFTAEQKADFVRSYDATPVGERGAFLRRNGLYLSHISYWRDRPAADAKRAAKKHSDRVKELEQQISDLEARLTAAHRTVDTLGKAFELLEHISKSSDTGRKPRES
jgi:transposase